MDIPPVQVHTLEYRFADQNGTSGHSLPLEMCVVSDFPMVGRSLTRYQASDHMKD